MLDCAATLRELKIKKHAAARSSLLASLKPPQVGLFLILFRSVAGSITRLDV